MWCNCALACGWRCTSFDFAEALGCLFICLSVEFSTVVHRVTANEQGLALLGDLKIVRPVLLPNRITDDEIKNKKPNRYSSAGTEDAMLLKMMLQGHAPITPNPM